MCGIVDANVANEVFGDDRPPAGVRFFDWLASPRGQLVVGGDLLRELGRNRGFVRWLGAATRVGRARSIPNEAVNARADEVRRGDTCRSDDEHVLALALVSGARLLYTNDAALIVDFKNREIVANPRGKVYTTAENKEVTNAHRRLLGDRTLCRAA